MGDGFSNPVAQAGGTLVRVALKSINYVLGLAGWKISKDGNVEFNNGTFRGTLQVGPGTGLVKVIAANLSEIDIDPSALNPQIVFFSPDHTNTAIINATGGASGADLGMNSGRYTPADAVVRRARIYMADTSDVTQFHIMKDSNQTTKGGFVQLTSVAGFFGYADDDGGIGRYLTYQITNPFASTTVGFNILGETWHAMTLLNGWTNFGGTDITAQYRIVPSPLFSIQIVGRIKPGTKADFTSIANLPAAYRPAHTILIPIGSTTAAGAALAGTLTPSLYFQTNGDLLILGVNTATLADIWFNAVIPLEP